MKLGYFTFPIHPKSKNYKKTLKEDISAIVLADKLGYYDAFIGEHISDELERITSCMIFISNLINQTKKIKLATGTLNLPNGHPLTFASSIAMLDHLAEGRLIMGIGPGSLISDMEAFGTLGKNRNEMFLECISQILQIWKKKPPYNIKGNYWNITTKKTYDKKISIGKFNKPLQKPHPEIVCTSLSRNLNSVIGLTEKGWNLISSNFLQPASLKFHYLGLKKAKKVPNFKRNWRVARNIFVNPNKSVVEKYVFSNSSPYVFCIKQILQKLKKSNRLDVFKKNPDDIKEKINIDNLIDDLVIRGSVEEVSEKILELKENVGNFDTITYVGIDWQKPALAKKSMELMATKVMPILNKAG